MEAGRRFEVARDQTLSGLTDRDRRLAHEIAAGVLRSRRALDREIREVLGTRWGTTNAELRDLLRIGTYQLRHLERVPAYAAVQSTVDAAKPLGKKRAAFVNAVLRKVAGMRAPARTPTLTAAQALADGYSHPEWLVRRWIGRYGPAAAEALLAHVNQRPPLVIQPARWPRERLEQSLTAAGIQWRPAPGGFGLVVERSQPRLLPGFDDGAFIVQGPGQARLLAHAGIPPGARVWDCCAAPGGKTVALSARGPVLASDRSRAGITRLKETVRRTGGRAVDLFTADALQPPLAPGSVDAVWLDAPCTATGVMSRHPDARWRLSPRRLEVACRRQAALLHAVAGVVRPQGWMVYSTCSLEAEENESQVDAFLQGNPAFVRDRADLLIWPPASGSDGGFVAVLRRS